MIHDKIIAALNSRRDAAQPELWQIHFRGRAIALKNGKRVWKKIGHAKSALLNDLYYIQRGVSSDNLRSAIRDLEARGDIVYVEWFDTPKAPKTPQRKTT